MFERFKFGSYRIEDTELANSKKNHSKTIGLVLVKFLDNSNVKFHLDVSKTYLAVLSELQFMILCQQKKAKGCDLLEKTFNHLELTERDYFGLKFCHNETEVSHKTIAQVKRGNKKTHYLIVQSAV